MSKSRLRPGQRIGRPVRPPAGTPKPDPPQPAPPAIKPPKSRPTPIGRPDPIVQLTEELRAFLATADEDDARAYAEVGQRLKEIKAKLPHGKWEPWIEAELPLARSTVNNILRLHDFAEAAPTLFDRAAPLGRSKVYELSRIPPAEVEQLLGQAHTIPTTGTTKRLDQMRVSELKKVIAARRGKLPDVGEKLRRQLRRQTRALIRTMRTLIAHQTLVSDDGFDELHDDVLQMLGEFAHAFDLDEP